MRVLYFGTYERDYPRNAQVISCLRRAGVEVVEHHVGVWEGNRQNWRAGIRAIARLSLAELRLLRRPPGDFDALVVGYPGHFDLTAARRASRGRPVVFNPLVSLSDTFVADRGRFRDRSLPARALQAVDRHALREADLVVADTRANANHLAELADLEPSRVKVAFVGAEERIFTPGWAAEEPFTALFVGKLIPLHGVETILAAARATPELRMRIVGSGQLESLLQRKPDNVEWIPWVAYERLPKELRRAGCALGIFGGSDKARRVIPNKAFQALACGAPLVTADTPAARELLAHERDALLVPPENPAALADALRRISSETGLASELGKGGLATYRERASEEILGLHWRDLIARLL